MSLVLKAIPVPDVDGLSGANRAPCLIWETTSARTSSAQSAPRPGGLFSLIVDGVDRGVFQFFLDEMAKAVPKKEGIRQLLIMNNASWHKEANVNWHHFEQRFLPAYSPDLNPIERLWLRLKADWFYDFIARTPEELSDRLCTAIRSFMDAPSKTAFLYSIRK